MKPPSERECRRIVLTRSEGFCERCCRATSLSMHHRVKRGQGGLWCPSNIVAVCGSGTTGCHGWIEHHPDAAEAKGFHVRPWCDPALTAIRYRWSQWALLTVEGGVDYQ